MIVVPNWLLSRPIHYSRIIVYVNVNSVYTERCLGPESCFSFQVSQMICFFARGFQEGEMCDVRQGYFKYFIVVWKFPFHDQEADLSLFPFFSLIKNVNVIDALQTR
jgi:hypothetical protein